MYLDGPRICYTHKLLRILERPCRCDMEEATVPLVEREISLNLLFLYVHIECQTGLGSPAPYLLQQVDTYALFSIFSFIHSFFCPLLSAAFLLNSEPLLENKTVGLTPPACAADKPNDNSSCLASANKVTDRLHNVPFGAKRKMTGGRQT